MNTIEITHRSVCFLSGLMLIYVSDLCQCFEFMDIFLAFNQLDQAQTHLPKINMNKK